MARIRLVLCDMDGTLVPFGADGVSRRTIDAVRSLRDAGVEFGPSSGREMADIVRFFRGNADCVSTGIMGNGKLVYVDGELVYKRPLPRRPLERMVDVLRGIPGAIFNFYLPLDERGRGSSDFGCTACTPQETATIGELFGETFPAGVFERLPEGELTTGAVLVAASLTTPELVQAQLEAEVEGLVFPIVGPFVMDVLERGWTKCSALPIIEETLGISRDEIAYFGDSANDLAMLEAIPHSFCMGNGSPEARALARWVIDSCEDDGAAKVMESLAAHGGELVASDWT